MAHVFISYAKKDDAFARKIVEALTHDGFNTWIDWKSIPRGEDWQEEIFRGIEEADAFIFLISRDSVRSRMCRRELHRATWHRLRILPVVIRTTRLRLPPALRNPEWILCRSGKDDFDAAIQQIRATIRKDYPWIRANQELRTKALAWHRHPDDSRLLGGQQLEDAIRDVAKGRTKDPTTTRLQNEYLLRSQIGQRTLRRRSRRLLLSAVAVLAVLSTFALLQWRRAVQERTIARSGELVAEAAYERDKHLDLSLLLSIEAFRMADTPQSRGAMLSGVQSSPQLLTFLKAHQYGVDALAFSPDGKLLASGGCAQLNGMGSCVQDVVFLWDLQTHQIIGQRMLGQRSWLTALAFSPDGKSLASGGTDASIIVWDVGSQQQLGKPLQTSGSTVDSLDFSPDGTVLAAGGCGEISELENSVGLWHCKEGVVELWDVATGKRLGAPMRAHANAVSNVRFLPGGKTIISADLDEILSWNTETHQPADLSLGASTHSVLVLPSPDSRTSEMNTAISPDGKEVARSAEGVGGYEVTRWDIGSKSAIGDPLSGQKSQITALLFSPDSSLLASGGDDGRVVLWPLQSERREVSTLMGPPSAVTSLAFAPDSSILASGGSDGNIILWSTAAVTPLRRSLVAVTDSAERLAFSPDSKSISDWASYQGLELWDLASYQSTYLPLTGYMSKIWAVSFGRERKAVATASCTHGDLGGGCVGSTIMLWGTGTGMQIGRPIANLPDWNVGIALSPDGKVLASATDNGEVALWDAEASRLLGKLPPNQVGWFPRLAFDPAGSMLAIGGCANYDPQQTLPVCPGSQVTFWNVRTQEPVGHPLRAFTETVSDIAFGADGQTVLTASNGEIVEWDLKTARSIGRPMPGLYPIALSPDTHTLAARGDDDSVTLWDLANHSSIGQLRPMHAVWDLAFSPDGKMLATTPPLTVWDLDARSWINASCQRAGRNFTRQEWGSYFPGEDYRSTCSEWPMEQQKLPPPPG